MALFGVFLGFHCLARTLQRSCKDIAKRAGNAVIAGLAGAFEVCKMIARWDILAAVMDVGKAKRWYLFLNMMELFDGTGGTGSIKENGGVMRGTGTVKECKIY